MTCGADHCITCADDGSEMTVVTLDAQTGLAWCAAKPGTRLELVEVSLLDPVSRGDRILVHAGTAIAALPAGARA